MKTNAFRRNRRGAILPLVGVSLVGLMALLVLVIDGASVQRQRRTTQTAADAGALAAAMELYRGRSDLVVQSGRGEASRNGFSNGSGGALVSVVNPTTTGYFVGSNYVQVTVVDTVNTLFGEFIGIPKFVVTSRATGGLAPANTCILALSPTASQALNVASGANLQTTSCGVMANSNADNAISIANNSTLTAEGIAAVGGISGTANGTPTTGVAPALDPLAYLEMPAVPACTSGYGKLSVNSSTTLSPGAYCGGIDISNPGTVLTLLPGMYFIEGGGLNVRSNATIRGAGVTIVNTNAPLANGGADAYDVISMASNSHADLSPMTTGALAGVLFYQDPNAGVTGTNYINSITSGAGTSLVGTMYFPTQKLLIKAGGDLVINGGIVANMVEVSTGSGNVTVTGISGGAQNFALKKGAIVE